MTTINSLPMDAFGRAHNVTPTVLERATSELFECEYSISPRGLIFHVYTDVLPVDKVYEAARAVMPQIIADPSRTEVILEGDEEHGLPPNVFIRVRDMRSDNSVTRGIITKALTALYNNLRGQP